MATLDTENTTVLGALTTKGLIHGARRDVYGSRKTSSTLTIYHNYILYYRTWTGTYTPLVGDSDSYSKACQVCIEFPAASSRASCSSYVDYLNDVFNSYVLNYDLDINSAKLVIPASGYYRIDYDTSETHLDYQISYMTLGYGITGTDSLGNHTYGLLAQFYGYGYSIVGNRNVATSKHTVLNNVGIDQPIPVADFFNDSSKYGYRAASGETMLAPTGYFAV